MKPTFLVPAGLLVAAALIAGCGGAGSIGAPAAPVHASVPAADGVAASGATAAKASPTPTPHASPTASPIHHPVENGDTFGMSGTILTTYQRPQATPDPEPTQTTLVDVTQKITVANPVKFSDYPDAVDFEIAETDQQTAPAPQTFKETIDDYFVLPKTIYVGKFRNVGYTSVDDTGYSVKFRFGNSDGLVDKLREIPGMTWKNNASAVINTTSTDNESSTQVILDNGSYSERIKYQNVGDQGGPNDNIARIHSNIDGSGIYRTPRLGTRFDRRYTYVVATPSADGSGTITETTTIPPTPNTTATPEVEATTVPNWIPAGYLGKKLATETDVDNGPVAIPSACPIPSKFGTSGTQIVATKVRIDPMFGEMENTTTSTYIIPNVGPACVTIEDTQNNYYDFSGQNGVGYFSGAPQQITNVAETLYLTSEQLESISSEPMQSSDVERSFVARVAAAQNRISASRVKQRDTLLHAFSRDPKEGPAFTSNEGSLK